MNNVILRFSLGIIWRLMIVYSVYIFLRGHNEPGGGFIGGLILALAFIIQDLAGGRSPLAERIVEQIPIFFAGVFGLLLINILTPALLGKSVLQGLWTAIPVPIAGKFSSVLLFDFAVYLIVSISSVYAYRVLKDRGERALS